MWKCGKEILTSLFVSALVLSNMLGAKIINIGRVAIPGGILCYALTCLLSDVIGERYGREQSKKTLICGLVCQAVCSALLAITLALPTADSETGATFNSVLGGSWWFAAASLVAYLLSQAADIAIFHSIREKLVAKGTRHKWIWNKASTAISQAVDTAVFITVAFGLGLGFMFEPGTRHILLQMMLGQYLVKIVLAAVDTPFFYLMTKRRPTGK